MTRHIEKQLAQNGNRVKTPRRPNITDVPGKQTLTQVAAKLGVTREHLSRVLHGHRKSRSLLARYRQLKQQTTLTA